MKKISFIEKPVDLTNQQMKEVYGGLIDCGTLNGDCTDFDDDCSTFTGDCTRFSGACGTFKSEAHFMDSF